VSRRFGDPEMPALLTDVKNQFNFCGSVSTENDERQPPLQRTKPKRTPVAVSTRYRPGPPVSKKETNVLRTTGVDDWSTNKM